MIGETERLAENFAETIAQLDCLALAVTIEHATVAANLDLHRRDPFDRLLIAQSLVENAPIVSNEQVFDRFGVQRIW